MAPSSPFTPSIPGAFVKWTWAGRKSEYLPVAPQGTDPVCKKVGNGQATDAELAELLAGYQAIGAVTPPKGEAAARKTKCDALVSAVKLVQPKDPGGVAAYKTAVNCKSCHSLHKPD